MPLSSLLFLTSLFSLSSLLVYFLLLENLLMFSQFSKSGKSNYLPMAITSLISKTMETITTKQPRAFFETSNLLYDHQYYFQQARSTDDLLAYAVHGSSFMLKSCDETRVMSIDISKAFDYVWHNCLFAELQLFGLHYTLTK